MASITNNQLTRSTSITAQSDVVADAAAAAAATTDGPLSSFKMHGYRPSPNLSDDVTYMDIVMLITRSSMLRQGSMGCILVRPPPPLCIASMMAPTMTTTVAVADGEKSTNSSQTIQNNEEGDNDSRDDEQFMDRIIAAATNTSLFQPDDSDVHAEINAIGQVSKRLHYCSPTKTSTTTTDNTSITPSMNNNTVCTTQGATAYITMPPCKRCFGALYASGIKRIVSRRQHSDILRKTATKVGIEMACMTQEELDQQQLRLNRLFANDSGNNENDNDESENVSREMNGAGEEGVVDYADDVVLKRRRQRKEEKRARKMAKIAQMNN